MSSNNPHDSTKTPSKQLLLSAVEIHLLGDKFEAIERPYPGDDAFDELRDRAEELFPYRQQEQPEDKRLIIVPLSSTRLGILSDPILLPVEDHLGLIGALIQRRLPALLAKMRRPMVLRPRRHRGLRGIKRSDDLVARTFKQMGTKVPAALAGFHKYERAEFKVRVVEMRGRKAFLALTVEFRRHLEITPSAAVLLERKLDLHDIWMCDPDAEQDRLLGPVIGIDKDLLVIDGPDGEQRVDPARCRPEPSIATFAALFERALRPEVRSSYIETEWLVQAEQTSGRGYIQRLANSADYFGSLGNVQIAPSVAIRFGELIAADFGTPEPSAEVLRSVMYCFSSDRNAIHEFPSRGLTRFGPFDSRTFDKKTPRLLVVAPHEQRGEVDEFVRRLLEGTAKEGQGRFEGGLGGIYRLSKIIPQYISVPLPRSGSTGIGSKYVASIQNAFDPSRPPDVALVFLRDEDAFLDKDNPYLAAKAYLLSQGIPSQEILSHPLI